MIATDHAPHTREEKGGGNGAGALRHRRIWRRPSPCSYTHLVLTGEISLGRLADLLTRRPARLFGLPWGELAVGGDADLTVIDLEEERMIDPDALLSKGKNTPFAGWRVKGWPVLTLVAGRVAWDELGLRVSLERKGGKSDAGPLVIGGWNTV